MQDIKKFISERLAQLIDSKGLSARGFSVSIGQNPSYIGKIINGQNSLSYESLQYICNHFGITVSEFFDENISNPIELKELLSEAKKMDQDSLIHLTAVAKDINKPKET